MPGALEEHDEKVNLGGRNITNLCFADVIYALEEHELEALDESLTNSVSYRTKSGDLDKKNKLPVFTPTDQT